MPKTICDICNCETDFKEDPSKELCDDCFLRTDESIKKMNNLFVQMEGYYNLKKKDIKNKYK